MNGRVSEEMVRAWEASEAAVRETERTLIELKARHHDATKAVARAVLPGDYIQGETFNVWTDDGLLSVCVGNGAYTVRWRAKVKS